VKVTRIICSVCGAEESHTEDSSNLHEYSEELVYRMCSGCKNTPEAKLLAVIFGDEAEGGKA